MSVTATMDVPDLFITWSHTYTSDDIVEVPGFTASLPSVVSAGVYVQVALTPKGDELRVTVGTSYRIHDQPGLNFEVKFRVRFFLNTREPIRGTYQQRFTRWICIVSLTLSRKLIKLLNVTSAAKFTLKTTIQTCWNYLPFPSSRAVNWNFQLFIFLSTSRKDFLEVQRGPWGWGWRCLWQTLKWRHSILCTLSQWKG